MKPYLSIEAIDWRIWPEDMMEDMVRPAKLSPWVGVGRFGIQVCSDSKAQDIKYLCTVNKWKTQSARFQRDNSPRQGDRLCSVSSPTTHEHVQLRSRRFEFIMSTYNSGAEGLNSSIVVNENENVTYKQKVRRLLFVVVDRSQTVREREESIVAS
ncbi:hypothetical protein Ccrd_004275 [Cynara cardunculus var. scolymus]|uniref:Uncharacterized protein n=1 Tax=Cynara cardunculus var. scolymus TaxID=59895 RepID=A0A124SCF8_CYNCS|nr:hypothetical protein Ccrd_004275 [Cynara cardunculus var. scolymus]